LKSSGIRSRDPLQSTWWQEETIPLHRPRRKGTKKYFPINDIHSCIQTYLVLLPLSRLRLLCYTIGMYVFQNKVVNVEKWFETKKEAEEKKKL
jgi:hypothetical protein